MYRSFLLSLLLASAFGGSAQTFYNNGAAVSIAPGTALYVAGDLTNAAGGTLSNGGTLTITGNVVNNGTMTAPAGGTITFSGTTAQTLAGTAAVVARDVVVNNTAGIALTTPLSVDGTLTFTAGILDATNAAAPVIFTANGSVAGTPTNSSHIYGAAQKQGTGAFTFPIGNATDYQPVGVNLSANSAGLTARYYAADAGGPIVAPLRYVNRREYWDLTPVGTATGTVTVYYDSYNNTGIGNVADLRVAHKTAGQWSSEGGTATGTPASGSVTSNSLSSWSPFALGSVSASSPLPVSLLRFEGMAEKEGNRLRWQVVPEAALVFGVERMDDQGTFKAIAQITGTTTEADYTFYDAAPAGKVQYYRLQLTGADGVESYSQTTAIYRDASEEATLSVYPVPAHEQVTITATAGWKLGAPVVVLDGQGREMKRFDLQTTQILSLQGWPAGMYLLRLPDGTSVRFTKQ